MHVQRIHRADNEGRVMNAGGPGVGFKIRRYWPGAMGTRVDHTTGGVPGTFPVTVRFHGSGETLEVTNADGHYFEQPFSGFDLLNCEGDGNLVGAMYAVTVFTSKGDGVIPSARPPVRSYQARERIEVPTSGPPLATTGLLYLPRGVRGVQFYFDGTERDITLSVLTWGAQGWFTDANKLHTTGAASWPRGVYVETKQHVERLHVQASAASAFWQADIDVEVD